MRHEMHIAVDPATGRVREGDLYGYVSLDAGQYFVGEIICKDATAWEALRQMAALPEYGRIFAAYVGRASQRGHGKMHWAIQEAQGDLDQDVWRGLPLTERVPSDTTEFTMTLLTDTIVPDLGPGQKLGFSYAWLESLFGPDIEVVRAFTKTREVDGFWQHLGLPRFRDSALVAGSAVGIRLLKSSPDLYKTLSTLEADGIGLRCHEGFGQVVFNHPLYDPALTECLHNSEISIPAALRPLDGETSHSQELALFKESWQASLEAQEPDKIWALEGFAEIARLIHQYASESLDSLRQALRDPGMEPDNVSQFGQPVFLLREPLSSTHSEKKHVKATRSGRKVILDLLVELKNKLNTYADDCPPEHLQRIGLEMLADRVGRAANQERMRSKNQASSGSSEQDEEAL